ncbi:MAG TPA: CsbD family protein [Rhizomicrobium sp.]
MTWEQIEGGWAQLSGKVLERWGKLTDNDLHVIAGKRDQLIGRIQAGYGIGRDEAESQVREFERALVAKNGPPLATQGEQFHVGKS